MREMRERFRIGILIASNVGQLETISKHPTDAKKRPMHVLSRPSLWPCDLNTPTDSKRPRAARLKDLRRPSELLNNYM